MSDIGQIPVFLIPPAHFSTIPSVLSELPKLKEGEEQQACDQKGVTAACVGYLLNLSAIPCPQVLLSSSYL